MHSFALQVPPCTLKSLSDNSEVETCSRGGGGGRSEGLHSQRCRVEQQSGHNESMYFHVLLSCCSSLALASAAAAAITQQCSRTTAAVAAWPWWKARSGDVHFAAALCGLDGRALTLGFHLCVRTRLGSITNFEHTHTHTHTHTRIYVQCEPRSQTGRPPLGSG